MRGLDTRCDYALANVLFLTDPDEAETRMYEIEWDARQLGYEDGNAGCSDTPLLFADVPLLSQAWLLGYQRAIGLMDDDRDCTWCADCLAQQGTRCPQHI